MAARISPTPVRVIRERFEADIAQATTTRYCLGESRLVSSTPCSPSSGTVALGFVRLPPRSDESLQKGVRRMVDGRAQLGYPTKPDSGEVGMIVYTIYHDSVEVSQAQISG